MFFIRNLVPLFKYFYLIGKISRYESYFFYHINNNSTYLVMFDKEQQYFLAKSWYHLTHFNPSGESNVKNRNLCKHISNHILKHFLYFL